VVKKATNPKQRWWLLSEGSYIVVVGDLGVMEESQLDEYTLLVWWQAIENRLVNPC
jgi:hypothetical protein